MLCGGLAMRYAAQGPNQELNRYRAHTVFSHKGAKAQSKTDAQIENHAGRGLCAEIKLCMLILA